MDEQKTQFSWQKVQLLVAAVALILLVGIAWGKAQEATQTAAPPSGGAAAAIPWGDMGKRLVEAGVIDREKFVALYGSLTPEQKRLLDEDAGDVTVSGENAGFLLNLLWALGLGNKNPILHAEMDNPAYGGAGNFASTGGWTLSKGPSTNSGQADAMEHYGKHKLIVLTPEQQKLLDRVSQNIYRPCCDNPTHFPDCNHGIAMLALLELLAKEGKSEQELYRAALTMNSYWFPAQYRTLEQYFASKGVAWSDVSPKEVLGKQYSSASGFARIAALMQPREQGGSSCSV